MKKISQETFTLGENIRTARKSKGYTLKELGEIIDVSAGFLSEVESGKKIPGGEVLFSLKRILEVSLDSLFESGESEPANESSILASASNGNEQLIQILQRQIEELREDKADLKARCKSLDEEKRLLIDRLSQLTDEFFQEKARLQERIDELKKELDAHSEGKESA